MQPIKTKVMERIGKRMFQFSFGYLLGAFVLSMLTLGQWIVIPIADWHWVAYPSFALYWVAVTGAIIAIVSEEEKAN